MAQGWYVNPTADTITFQEAPPVGVNNIVVREYASGTKNVTDIFALGAWSAANGYPSEVEFFADRLVFANTPTQPQSLWMSQSGNYTHFGRSQPIVDSDAVSVTLNARQVNAVRDLVPLDQLVLLTSGGEWKTTAGENDVITPSTTGFKPQTYWGSSNVPALIIGDSALFVQDRGCVVRDMSYQFERDGYRGNDLTVFSSHLLVGKPIREWAYQQTPDSIVWVVREDGVLLALTYLREQEVIAWTPQETDGFVESVCVIPEAGEDAVYCIVRREVDGVQARYVERLSSRIFDDVRSCTFMDSFLSFNGEQGSAITLRCNAIGSGGYTSDDDVNVVADLGASSPFSAADVGDQLWLTDADGEVLRLDIVGHSVDSALVCRPTRNVPESLQPGGGSASWAFARNVMSGLDHLEGREVCILSDGLVQANKTVTGGEITLDDPGVIVHVGLPYTADFQTLEVNNPGGESTRNRFKQIKKLSVLLQDTRNIKYGAEFSDAMDEWEPREAETYEGPPDLQQDAVQLDVSGTWSQQGRVCIRQDQPLPITILGVVPEVEFGQ